MKIYLASRYSRRLELCEYRSQLQALGHTVTSRWLNGSHQISDSGEPIGDSGERLVEQGDCEKSIALRSRFAMEDYRDVNSADMVISFTEPPRSSGNRGGRHVEYGMAVAMGKSLVVVGHRENLFHWLNDIAFFEDWESCLGWLAAPSSAGD